ncbi:MAG TPA: metallophosphoesterase [Kofleriaceae bacterium]|nr:metallophosphoesterase [Kofleriaceae bacterium]
MRAACVLTLAACGSSSVASPPIDAYVDLDAPARPGAGPGGGLLDTLDFAVIGDCRPANLDDTPNYPTAVATQIFADVQAEVPQPAFAVTTGDYMFASTGGTEAAPQLQLYLGARAGYANAVYPAMGNHECTGYTDSNCGPGGADGDTENYQQYLSQLVAPVGETRPYFIEHFAASDGTWSAKFVFIAGNAWNQYQAAWLDLALAEPSTYTFAVRHEPHYSETAPGVDPSTQILARHPLTMLLTGHTHSYDHVQAYKEIIVGNGGAPLNSGYDYGYVIIALQPDGTLQVTSYDYMTHATVDQFAINPDGSLVTP